MKIETKYSLGDKVWYIFSNKVESSTIESIYLTIGENNRPKPTQYRLNRREEDFEENKLFSSKDELLKTL